MCGGSPSEIATQLRLYPQAPAHGLHPGADRALHHSLPLLLDARYLVQGELRVVEPETEPLLPPQPDVGALLPPALADGLYPLVLEHDLCRHLQHGDLDGDLDPRRVRAGAPALPR